MIVARIVSIDFTGADLDVERGGRRNRLIAALRRLIASRGSKVEQKKLAKLLREMNGDEAKAIAIGWLEQPRTPRLCCCKRFLGKIKNGYPGKTLVQKSVHQLRRPSADIDDRLIDIS